MSDPNKDYRSNTAERMDLEGTSLTQPETLGTLALFVVTVAMAWAYACTTALKGREAIKKARHGYKAKSWLRTGLDQLRNWMPPQPQTAVDIRKRLWPKRKTALEFKRVV